jgi:hypothetical protein
VSSTALNCSATLQVLAEREVIPARIGCRICWLGPSGTPEEAVADLRDYVSEHLGDPDAVLVYFETVFSSARAWSCVIASISGSGC